MKTFDERLSDHFGNSPSDPFRMFDALEPKPLRVEHKAENKWIMIAVCLALLTVGSAFAYRFLGSGPSKTPFVFVEMRAIDSYGHPVAGARVALNGKKAGMTDSFGEWRRFIRTPLGSTLDLDVSKETGTGPISASKKLQVPDRLPASGELELSTRLPLTGPGSLGPKTATRPDRRLKR